MFSLSLIGLINFFTFLNPCYARNTAQEYPAPPMPQYAETKIKEKAGYGSSITYGNAGIVELGGLAQLSLGNEYFQCSVSPKAGWFFLDNFEISALITFSHQNWKKTSCTHFDLLAEPSYHHPFSKTMFGFFGLGFGISKIIRDIAGKTHDLGMTFQPRLGMNVLIGQSGILTPALFLKFTSSDMYPVAGGTAIKISPLAGIGIEYTIML